MRLTSLSAVIAALFVLTVGGADGSRSAGAEPIRIGAVFSETGGLRSIGSPGLAGMRLAAAEINAGGGILGRRVQLAVADSRSNPAAVARGVRRLIEDQRVVAIGGLNDSTLALAAGPVAQRAGIPFVTAGATLPTLPRTVGNGFFMAAFGDNAQAHAVADVARKDLGSLGIPARRPGVGLHPGAGAILPAALRCSRRHGGRSAVVRPG